MYRVSIKSFPDYKHLLQENYVEYKRSTCWSVLLCCKKTSWVELHFGKNFLSWVTFWKKNFLSWVTFWKKNFLSWVTFWKKKLF